MASLLASPPPGSRPQAAAAAAASFLGPRRRRGAARAVALLGVAAVVAALLGDLALRPFGAVPALAPSRAAAAFTPPAAATGAGAAGGPSAASSAGRPATARGALAPSLSPSLAPALSSDFGSGDEAALARFRLERASNFFAVTSQEDYEILLRSAAEAGRVLVVDYYAPWCRACQRLLSQLHKVALEDRFRDVFFASVNFEQNRELCKQKEIKKLPTLEIYQGEDLKQQWSGSSKKRLIERLEQEMGIEGEGGDSEEEKVAEASQRTA